jgi:transcriptional regulator with XRE-family HTH domain
VVRSEGHQRRCQGCGTPLARDNRSRLCSPCSRHEVQASGAPAKPDGFWRRATLRDALGARHFGQVLYAYRHEHRPVLTQAKVGRWLGLTQGQVSRIEIGPPIRDLDALVHWARVLRIPAGMLWFDLPGQTRQAPDNERENATDRLSRRITPRQPNLAALHAPPEEIIAYLQEQWHLLVRADNLFGPAHVLWLVHEQLKLIESLLPDVHNGVRTSLLSLGAEYAESAAWLHEDADDQKAAFWTSRALEWAHAAGDHRLVAWALFRRSQQVARDGDVAQAIGLAQAAQNRIRPDDATYSSGRWSAAVLCQATLGCAGVG